MFKKITKVKNKTKLTCGDIVSTSIRCDVWNSKVLCNEDSVVNSNAVDASKTLLAELILNKFVNPITTQPEKD